MVSIKRKVTIKTKTAQEKTPVAVDDSDAKLEDKHIGIDSKPVNPIQKPENSINTGRIIGSISIVAVIIVGAYFFGFKGDNNTGHDRDTLPVQQTDQTETIGHSCITEQIVTSNETNHKEVSINDSGSETTDTIEVTEDPIPNQLPLIQQKQDTSLKDNVSTESISSNLEERALRVIRGDFGNGQERKDKLGTAYSEIQSMVNEMYRKGLVN